MERLNKENTKSWLNNDENKYSWSMSSMSYTAEYPAWYNSGKSWARRWGAGEWFHGEADKTSGVRPVITIEK